MATLAGAAEIPSLSNYKERYGSTKGTATVDPGKELPSYPAVEPSDAVSTWEVRPGFHLELAAHEPQVRDPIALCFDERGRMFVCEMIDYSEMRDAEPHLGRVSVLEDKDGDGFFESSSVFADDLPWPTGLIWANGGLFVGATPDIWRLEDRDEDGRAEVREKAFTGFGTGLKLLNVQGLMNSFTWGHDNRVHVLGGRGNRGIVSCPNRPELEPVELGGNDFWFDPVTLEFGLEAGGAQYGMSFDNYGRKFGCSNSDHLQHWLYDDGNAIQNPYYSMPNPRQSIAVDGGAAEVFRISPDEPWRILRTRWRIAGVVKGVVEGGGRVSGYFTGATGTTIYRGDAYGPEFVNNSFTGDAGGQLIHRKIIRPAEDGIGLIGERPADEQGFEFAASRDTWVRMVNFANAPDGCLYACDMYREVIEHPWSIPDEIKQHLDLNRGNQKGRIYRIVPDAGAKRVGESVDLADSTVEELVEALSHPNGWHRDTAQRLLFERQPHSAMLSLRAVLEQGENPLAKLHALSALAGFGKLNDAHLTLAINDGDELVRERALQWARKLYPDGLYPFEVLEAISQEPAGESNRVEFHRLLALSQTKSAEGMVRLLSKLHAGSSPWLAAAVASGTPDRAMDLLGSVESLIHKGDCSRQLHLALLEIVGARNQAAEIQSLLARWSEQEQRPSVDRLASLDKGLRRAGSSLQQADSLGQLAAMVEAAAETAIDDSREESERLEATEFLKLFPEQRSREVAASVLDGSQSESIQLAAIAVMVAFDEESAAATLLEKLPALTPKARSAAVTALVARKRSLMAALEAVRNGQLKPGEFTPSQVQELLDHRDPNVVKTTRRVLASMIPPSREEVGRQFAAAVDLEGDPAAGRNHYIGRCMACHRAEGMGMELGPDLVTVKDRGRDGLLEAILAPHKEVAPQYIAYTVNAKDGRSVTGVITRDDASLMEVKVIGGVVHEFRRNEIKGSSSEGRSLMPEGLETGMSVQDMADLLSFLESL